MKKFTTVLALAVIAFIIFLSGNLFLQGALFSSCTLMVIWIASLIVWVKYAASLVKFGTVAAKNPRA
jgi:hypothetical protein